ncbi:MAG: LPS export ABC transporter permease LptF [Pseudomonadota bacterium]
MGLFSRYLFRQTTGAMMLILLSLTGVVWIGLALKRLNLMTTQGQDSWLFFKMTLLALPNMMTIIAPIAMLIAVVHTLNRLNSDSELIILTAGGATVWRIARPLLALALLLSICVSLVNHAVMPWSLRELRSYIIQVRTDLIGQVLQPGVFSAPEAGITFHIRERTRSGELRGILMHDARKKDEQTSYLAARGQILAQPDGGAVLLMSDGRIIRKGGPGAPPQLISFERYPLDLSVLERKRAAYSPKPRERYFHELVNPDPKDWRTKRQAGKLRSELHERFSSALYPFVFVMIALACVGQARTTRQTRMQAVVAALLLAALCRMVGLMGTNLVTITPAAIPLPYAVPLIAIALATFSAWRNMTPRPPSRLQLAMQAVNARVRETLSRLSPWGKAARAQPAPAE